MAMPDTDDTQAVGRVHALRSSRGYRASSMMGALLVLGLIVGMALYFGLRGDDTATAPATAPTTQTASPTAQAAPSTLPTNAFGIPVTDLHGTRIEVPTNPVGQVLPQTADGTPANSSAGGAAVPAPQGLMWQQVDGEPLPFSTSDGPTAITADGVPSGFAHTRQGAALAAWQIGQRASWASNEHARAVLAAAAVVEPAAQATADQFTTKGPEFFTNKAQLPQGTFNAPYAVKIDNYDGAYAHVTWAIPTSGRDDSYIATTISFDMVWRENTWKWVVPAQVSGQQVTTLDGFTAW